MSLIIQTVSRGITPFIFVYAIYLILTGHTSPGGAFAGGVAAGLLIVLWYAAFKLSTAEGRVSCFTAHMGRILGLLGFLTMGAVALLLGKGFLENFLPKVAGHLTMSGVIIMFALSVGILVGCETVLIFYYLFGRRPKGERK